MSNLIEHSDGEDLGLFLINCASTNQLEALKEYLTNPNKNKDADIHTDEDCILSTAVWNGHLDIVQFVLESPFLNEKIKLTENNNTSYVLPTASRRGHVHILKYLFDFIKSSNDDEMIKGLEEQKDYILLEAIDSNKKRVLTFLMDELSSQSISRALTDIVKNCCKHDRMLLLNKFFYLVEKKNDKDLNLAMQNRMESFLLAASKFNNLKALSLLGKMATLENLQIALKMDSRLDWIEKVNQLIVERQSQLLKKEHKNKKDVSRLIL